MRAIISVQNQSFTDYEFIIVNDGSTDGTFTMLREVALSDRRIRVFNNKVNLGLQKSLNFAISNAKTNYIARIDDDDEWIDLMKLDKQYKFLLKNPNYLLIGTAFENSYTIFKNPISDQEIRQQILFRCPFHHSSVMFVKKVSNFNALYNEDLTYAEDWELWLRIGLVGKMINLSGVSIKVSSHNNLSESNFLSQNINNLRFIKKYSKFYPNQRLAFIYHYVVILFFKLIPIDSLIHKVAKRLYQSIFNKI